VITAEQMAATPERPAPSRTQKRLRGVEVDELVAAYQTGDSIEGLAEHFGVHRTTVMAHLRRREVELRAAFTAWDHDDLRAAAAHYASGASLASVAARFGVDPSTVANRLRRDRDPSSTRVVLTAGRPAMPDRQPGRCPERRRGRVHVRQIYRKLERGLLASRSGRPRQPARTAR
jgi:transposase